MARYCGQCAAILSVSAVQEGRCAVCGASVEVSEQTFDARALAEAEDHTVGMVGVAPSEAPGGVEDTLDRYDPPPYGVRAGADGNRYVWLPRQSQQTMTPALLWTLAALLVVALVAMGLGLYSLTQHGTLSTLLIPFTSSTPSLSTASGTAPASTSASGTPAHSAPTSTVNEVGAPTATSAATVSPTPLPSSTPLPPSLLVTPTSITIQVCTSLKSTTFTVANTGGMPMAWTVSSGVGHFNLAPSGGTLNPGRQVKVTVTGILGNGLVRVNAGIAKHSPQTVTIKCTL